MATTGRRRQNSSASRSGSISASTTLALHPKPSASAEPVSAHVADPFLKDFLQPSFDAAAYWNATLASASASSSSSAAPSAADLTAQAQTTLSQIGAHTTRLTNTLTQLTDDILRSGSRLAYEIELLRGETIGMAEVLAAQQQQQGHAAEVVVRGEEVTKTAETMSEEAQTVEPPALDKLRMLAQVRSRLDAVIRAFGDAMEFVMPPSAMSVSASFLSVSGPDAMAGVGGGGSGGGATAAAVGSGTTTAAATSGAATAADEAKSTEDRGQLVLRTLREEVARLLAEDKNNVATAAPPTGTSPDAQLDGPLEAAQKRVATLRALCQVWAGTAEERARVRFVDSLQRMVDERIREREIERERERRERERERQQRARANSNGGSSSSSGGNSAASSASTSASTTSAASSDTAASAATANKGYTSGYGFISQLQKIRSGL